MHDYDDGPGVGFWVVSGLGTVAVIAALAIVGLGTSWFGLVTTRPMMQYAEDSRRLTFEHSRAHMDGVNDGIQAYCLNMEGTNDPSSKLAFAHYINGQASSYEGPLGPEAARCFAEANSVLQVAARG